MIVEDMTVPSFLGGIMDRHGTMGMGGRHHQLPTCWEELITVEESFPKSSTCFH